MSCYNGWDREEMRTAGDNAALQHDYIPSSSFTPINRPVARQLPTPELSAPPLPSWNVQTPPATLGQPNFVRPDETASPSRIDLGAAVSPKMPRGTKRTRKKKVDGDEMGRAKAPKQRRVSEDLRVRKPTSRKTKSNIDDQIPHSQGSKLSLPETSHELNVPVPGKVQKQVPSKRATSKKQTSGMETVREQDSPDCLFAASDAMEDEFDDIFNSIDLDTPTNTTTANMATTNTKTTGRTTDTLRIAKTGIATTNEEPKKRYPTRKRTTRQTNPLTDGHFDDDAFFLPTPESSPSTKQTITSSQGTPSAASQASRRNFVSPATPKTQALVEKAVEEQTRKPIVRNPFPSPVRDHSPIIGLSPNLLLRTCFRTGEAINQASHSTKHKQRVVFELYARIHKSYRDETKQYFTFADLFHDKPPYIKATYDAGIWKGVQLFDYDSGRLLRKNTICRCIGEIKREGKEWVMHVFNIWESTWEDIEWVEGIVKE